MLTRVQHIVEPLFANMSQEDVDSLLDFLGGSLYLPVPVYKEEELYPQLLRPETFLWKEHSLQRGIPIEKEYFYPQNYSALSGKELERHLSKIVADYLFCAKLHKQSQEQWIRRLEDAYVTHGFIQLANEKNSVVEAVEKMNKNSLLSVLHYPEDVAFWRHRVEIVMRPYRHVPDEWKWKMCDHQKNLVMQAENDSIHCRCETCNYGVTYHVSTGQVTLPLEVDLAQATKRIATIERQFNDMAEKTPKVISVIRDLHELKVALTAQSQRLEQLVLFKHQVEALSHPLVEAYQEILSIHLPLEPVEPSLLSLVSVEIPDMRVLKKVALWKTFVQDGLESQLEMLLENWGQAVEEAAPKATDVVFQMKDLVLMRGDAEKIKEFLEDYEEEVPTQMLVKILNGEGTSKIRRLSLHEAPIFGLLRDWPSKYVTKALLEMR
ncbi:RQC-minor-2 family DNA-binding protein [Mangrovibacillus cuniculi]|uniref:RQC domain-containing protein n=1 Tax=Mangrovibacillus cuniculi TaxID=2593652 RepID=A0A7S8HED9_9BACI|nr:RQC-minor-2 family DNA-binding protein [Mangrovibacillus cuniculi]QPC45638.1 hypothetical protein G8O30_00950 [Mangrovibacillus cuniculi]